MYCSQVQIKNTFPDHVFFVFLIPTSTRTIFSHFQQTTTQQDEPLFDDKQQFFRESFMQKKLK